MLEAIANNLWTVERPLRFFGVEIGSRMTVVRLRSGALFVHSPVALDPVLQSAVDALGPVGAIVAPCRFHHLHVAEWARAYPQAALFACPGLEKKRPDLRFTHVLGDAPHDDWRGELDQVFFGACAMQNEVVFHHRESQTIICADFVFNLAAHPSRLTRVMATLTGQREPGPTWLERVAVSNRVAAREQVGRVLAWDAERMVLGHGELISADATEVVRRAYGWL